MSKRLARAVAGLGLLLAGCGAGGSEPSGPAPALPTGRLLLAGSGVTDARYVALDDLQWSNGLAQVTVLLVGRTSTGLGGRYALTAKRETVNCGTRTIANETAAHFDAAGSQQAVEQLTGRVGRTATGSDAEAPVVCDRQSGPVVLGFRAAQREWQAPPPELAEQARGNPEDFDSWAWLCAGDARSKSSQAPLEACDKAVALKPDDIGVRIDRGYLKVMQRDEVGADTDFKAVLARDPKDARALYGRSLLAALRGDAGASAAARDEARAIDPRVSAWVTDTYGILIGPEYR